MGVLARAVDPPGRGNAGPPVDLRAGEPKMIDAGSIEKPDQAAPRWRYRTAAWLRSVRGGQGAGQDGQRAEPAEKTAAIMTSHDITELSRIPVMEPPGPLNPCPKHGGALHMPDNALI